MSTSFIQATVCSILIPQEPLPEPTAAEIAREVEQEAAVFSQAANVDRLLMMLRNMDPAKDNLADDEEIQVCAPGCSDSSVISAHIKILGAV